MSKFILTSIARYQTFLGLVNVLKEVEHNSEARFIRYKYLWTLFVLVAAYQVSFEKVVPWICFLEGACTVEFQLLFLQSEQKELPWFNEDQFYIVFTFQVEDWPRLRFYQCGIGVHRNGTLFREGEEFSCRQVNQLNDLLINGFDLDALKLL